MRGRRRGGRAQPYDRNKFLQANFRFLVSDSVDLRRHAGDADLMLDWDDVLQVRTLFPFLSPFSPPRKNPPRYLHIHVSACVVQ